jgi:hypothetical protein
VARAARLHADQRVRITPHGEKFPTQAERLAGFDPALHGGEAKTVPPVASEAW